MKAEKTFKDRFQEMVRLPFSGEFSMRNGNMETKHLIET
jgi:hypothetical protein